MTRNLVLLFLFSTAVLFAGELKLDTTQSWIRATAKATGHRFDASPAQFECELGVGDKGQLSVASFSCAVSDLTTGKEKRDKEMWHWLESEKFPTISFVMTDLIERDGQKLMVGNFSLHNQQKSLEIPVVVVESEDAMQINGEVTLDTTQFSLPIIRKMVFLTVKPMVTVKFQLRGSI